VFFLNVHKISLYLYIINTIHLKYSIGVWVQSRKEDQILRLNLNPYCVIFKLLTFHGGCGIQEFQMRDSVWMRVLGAVLHDIRGVLPHQHSEAGR
jgi:hypothetical protein